MVRRTRKLGIIQNPDISGKLERSTSLGDFNARRGKKNLMYVQF